MKNKTGCGTLFIVAIIIYFFHKPVVFILNILLSIISFIFKYFIWILFAGIILFVGWLFWRKNEEKKNNQIYVNNDFIKSSLSKDLTESNNKDNIDNCIKNDSTVSDTSVMKKIYSSSNVPFDIITTSTTVDNTGSGEQSLYEKEKREREQQEARLKRDIDTKDKELSVKISNFIKFGDKKIVEKFNNNAKLSATKEINRINNYDGFQFERYLGRLLKKLNYYDIDVTKKSSDQGIDVIATKNGIKYGFQCKHYKNKVGNKAIQEIYAGIAFYDLDKGIVITNNSFTASAKELASKVDIKLWDKSSLYQLIIKVKMLDELSKSDNKK